MHQADAGGDGAHALAILGIGEALETVAEGCRERVRVADLVRERGAEGLGVRFAGRHERDGTLRRRARVAHGWKRHLTRAVAGARPSRGTKP